MKRIVIVMVFLFAASCTTIQPEPTAMPTLTLMPTLIPTPMPTESPCVDEKIANYINNYSPLYSEWADALELASSTPKINLAPQIENLQRIKRDITPLEPPLCLQVSHDNIVKYMEKIIEGLMGYMSGKPDAETVKLIEEGSAFLSISTGELDKIIECMPNCEQNYKY